MAQFILTMINGNIANVEIVKRAFSNLRDGNYQVKITAQRQRSHDQNSYFHGVVLPVVFEGLRDAGYDDIQDEDDAKDFVKDLFSRRSMVDPVSGELTSRVVPTHKLTTLEFSEMIEKIIRWGAEWLNIQIPYPNEYLKG